MNEVNQRLRSAVEMAGIRRPELASLLGVSVTTVNGWFSSGRTIPKLKQNAIEAIVKQARRPELKFDDIVSFSVRLTRLNGSDCVILPVWLTFRRMKPRQRCASCSRKPGTISALAAEACYLAPINKKFFSTVIPSLRHSGHAGKEEPASLLWTEWRGFQLLIRHRGAVHPAARVHDGEEQD